MKMFNDDYVDVPRLIDNFDEKIRLLKRDYEALNISYSNQFIELTKLKNENIQLKKDLETLKQTIRIVNNESSK